ncbi:MAG: hypothetical protein ACI4T5_06050 [Prevotella sp.]
MYICNECGAIFEDPYEYEEKHGFDYGPFEKWRVCPSCYSPDIAEAALCARDDEEVEE